MVRGCFCSCSDSPPVLAFPSASPHHMASKIGPSFSCSAASLPSPFQSRTSSIRLSLSQKLYSNQQPQQLPYNKVGSFLSIQRTLKLKCLKRLKALVLSKDQSEHAEFESVAQEQESLNPVSDDLSPASSSFIDLSGTGGKPGVISFYNHPYKRDPDVIIPNQEKSPNNILWFMGPAILVASFIFPSLYLRRIISAIFEDSLLTDFLILFFTEALFYCGVAIFLLVIDHLRRPLQPGSTINGSSSLTPQMGQRISSVATLVLSLIIPLVTMGLVWPWTGPAASATLSPYLVGIVVQFAFEQYARYKKSPSWSAIPVIFQVYRLHQLNRAAQLVTALSFTVRGAEMTAHNMAINSSLGTLLNVLQFLGVICIWSLSSFLMRFLPSAAPSVQ